MTSPLKSSYFYSLSPLSRYVLNVSPSSNRTSLIATTPPHTNGKDFLLLKAQFSRKYTQCKLTWYTPIIQQTVLSTKSSHIKVSSQVSLIDCLVFNQQETISVLDTQRKNDSLTMKFIKNYHMGTFKKYVRSRFLSFDHLHPLFALARFRAPPPPKVRSFWLELTLSPSI